MARNSENGGVLAIQKLVTGQKGAGALKLVLRQSDQFTNLVTACYIRLAVGRITQLEFVILIAINWLNEVFSQ